MQSEEEAQQLLEADAMKENLSEDELADIEACVTFCFIGECMPLT